MKFLAAAALASVAIAAPLSKDGGPEPTRTVSHHRPTGTGNYHPHGTGVAHGTGRPHHHHKPHGTGVAHGTGRPHHHHKPHGTGISHSGHARPTEYHGPYEKPSSGFAMPTERPILPRDETDAEGDLINDTTETGSADKKAHDHKSGAAKPTGHHRHHKSGEHGHAHPTGHHHNGGEHGHAKPTGHHKGGKTGHAKPTSAASSAAAAATAADAGASDAGASDAGASDADAAGDVEKRADDALYIMPTPVMGFPSGAVRPTGHHSRKPHETGKPHGTGVHYSHKPHGTGAPHHHGKPHGTGKPHGPHGPRPTGFRWGPGIEITPEMASSLFAEHGKSMPTGFFSSLFAAHSQNNVPAQATPVSAAADY